MTCSGEKEEKKQQERERERKEEEVWQRDCKKEVVRTSEVK